MEDTPAPANVRRFIKTLAGEMAKFCGPIFITPGCLTYPEEMIDNGTYSLIDTGQKRLLVTCHHAWQAYLDFRQKKPATTLGLALGGGDRCIAFARPESQIIDLDVDLDLVVFDFEPIHLNLNGIPVQHEKQWFRIPQWPIPKAEDQSYIVLMGFPGKLIEKSGRVCTFKAQPVALKVSGIGSRKIWALNESENKEVFSDIKGWLGGLSGSPAYALHRDGASLVGFVKSGYKQEGSAERGLQEDSVFAGSLVLTHAAFLNQDGTLVKGAG